MYLKIDEEILKRIENITTTDYEAVGEFLPSDSVNCIIEDLLIEIDHLNEEIEDIKQDVEDNFRRIPVAEQYGISDRDFI